MFESTNSDCSSGANPASQTNAVELKSDSLWERIPWDFVFLGIVIVASLILHFMVLSRPPTIVWDEKWYVGDAQSIIKGAGDLRLEHPALAKLFIIAGIHLFGNNAFGWRFFSVIIGVPAIIIFFFICRKLKLSRSATVIGTFLFAFDDMYFVHASLALLDIYMLTFMLLAFLLYLDRSYLMSGITIAISTLCKTTGVFGIIAVFAHWLLFRRDKPKWMLASLAASAIAYLSLDVFLEFFIQGKLINPISRAIGMLRLNAADMFTNPPLSISSHPWEWVLPWKIIVYAYGAAPEPQYISFISWTIQLLIIPIFIYLIYKAVKGNFAARFALAWFVFTYLIWFPIDLITNRVTYVYYFLPTTGSVCIGIALAITDIINKFRKRSAIYGKVTRGAKFMYVGIGLYLALHLAIFIIFNPNFPTIFKFWLPPFAAFSSWANFFP